MRLAARITDKTSHDGVILGPGVSSVLIEGLPAAVVGDNHHCDHHTDQNDFVQGSSTVFINGKSALRANDLTPCGAIILPNQGTVFIGS